MLLEWEMDSEPEELWAGTKADLVAVLQCPGSLSVNRLPCIEQLHS
jgi:hypothetical protein